MKKNIKFLGIAAAALMAVSPIIATPINIQGTTTTQTEKVGKYTLTMHRENPVVNSSAEPLRGSWDYPNKDVFKIKAGVVTLRPNATLNWTGKTKMISGRQYLYVGNGGWVNAYAVDELNGKGTLLLGHNSYVYNSKGKRIKKFNGQSKLLKGSLVNHSADVELGEGKYFIRANDKTYKHLPYKRIKGKDYFAVGNGGYVKANNVHYIDGEWIFTQGPIKVKINTTENLSKLSGKKMLDLKTIVKRGKILTVDQKVSIPTTLSDPAIFYRIKGTKTYINSEFVDLTNFDMPTKNI